MQFDRVSLVRIAESAGAAIMDCLSQGVVVQYKSDCSVVTNADAAAQQVIQTELSKLYPDIPFISEEGELIPFETRKNWRQFWLVDPLDSTRSFVKGFRDFVVCIALIQDAHPVLGIIHHPVSQTTYYADPTVSGVIKITQGKDSLISPTFLPPKDEIVMLSSYFNHSHEALQQVLDADPDRFHLPVRLRLLSSALKFCWIVEGWAHYYPRLIGSMEWDVAAGHALLRAVGKSVYQFDSISFSDLKPLQYNKMGLRNPSFCAF